MKQNKPMKQIDKLKEEFDKEFGPKTIWVVPSKENIETIKDIWSWIIQNFTPKEEVKEKFDGIIENLSNEIHCMDLTENPEKAIASYQKYALKVIKIYKKRLIK